MIEKENSTVIEEQINSIYRELTAIHEEAKSTDIHIFIEKIKVLENILKSKSVFLLLDHKGFNPWYVSKSIQNFGYTQEQVINGALGLGLKSIDFKQVYSFRHLIKWGRDFRKLIGPERMLKSYSNVCGIAFKDKQKNRRVFMLKLTCLCLDKNQKVSLSLIQADDITAIYKSTSYWVKYICDTGYTPLVRYNFSNTPNKEFNTFLTNRELEILRLAAQQKKNIEIGKELEISVNTVERHRKNMISKVGVTDMTALITIAKMVDII